jgi:hypothetical protein
MSTALIGHTGFVGGNLLAQARFDACFNSTNIEEMRGRVFDLVVCSGARAEKWLANRDPQADRAGIARLTSVLESIRAKKLVLISTVDVFRSPIEVDESSPVTLDGLCPYGLHRFELEEFVRDRFSTLVIRLPGLFGPGLKKNAIYDFLHNNNCDNIHHAAVYQFYDTRRLWRDLEIALNTGLPLLHFATEPVSIAEVARTAFACEFQNAPTPAAARYDFRTRYAEEYGASGDYLVGRRQVLDAIRDFVTSERRRAA